MRGGDNKVGEKIVNEVMLALRQRYQVPVYVHVVREVHRGP